MNLSFLNPLCYKKLLNSYVSYIFPPYFESKIYPRLAEKKGQFLSQCHGSTSNIGR